MRTRDEIISGVLITFSIIAFFVGVVSIIHAHGPLERDLQRLMEETSRNLRLAQSAAEAMRGQGETVDASMAPRRSASAFFVGQVGPSLDVVASRTSQVRAEALATDLRRSSTAYDGLEAKLTTAGVSVDEYRRQLEGTRHAIEALDLPTATARRVSLQGGLYILLSVILAVLTGIWMELKRTRTR